MDKRDRGVLERVSVERRRVIESMRQLERDRLAEQRAVEWAVENGWSEDEVYGAMAPLPNSPGRKRVA